MTTQPPARHTRVLSQVHTRRVAWMTLALIALALLGVLGVAEPARAQPYPSRPIKLVVPFPTGGAVDYFARAVQPAISEALGQPVVIENRGGAGGMVGAGIVAKSPADGYTLLLGNIASMAINKGIYASMPYEPLRDFAPVIRTVDVHYVLTIHPSVPAGSVADLIAWARAHPGRIRYGSAGSGSLPHLGTELLKAQAGIDMLHVPYKGGGPMVTDLVGGTIELALGDQANLMPHVQAGRLRALAVATPERSATFPALPTLAEAGLPGFEATAWQGLFAPAGTDVSVVDRLNRVFNDVMRQPAVRERLVAGGLAPVGGTAGSFRQFVADEIDKWTRISKQVGARAD